MLFRNELSSLAEVSLCSLDQGFPKCAPRIPRDPRPVQGIRAYMSVTATLKCTYFLKIKVIMFFFQSNGGTNLVRDIFILYDH